MKRKVFLMIISSILCIALSNISCVSPNTNDSGYYDNDSLYNHEPNDTIHISLIGGCNGECKYFYIHGTTGLYKEWPNKVSFEELTSLKDTTSYYKLKLYSYAFREEEVRNSDGKKVSGSKGILVVNAFDSKTGKYAGRYEGVLDCSCNYITDDNKNIIHHDVSRGECYKHPNSKNLNGYHSYVYTYEGIFITENGDSCKFYFLYQYPNAERWRK